MGNYAVIKDDIVSNIIVAESKEIAESATGSNCVEIDSSTFGVSVGWTYSNNTFTPSVQ